jgi:hypothetical protein
MKIAIAKANTIKTMMTKCVFLLSSITVKILNVIF